MPRWTKHPCIQYKAVHASGAPCKNSDGMHIVNAKQIHSDQVELVPNERRKCPQPLPVTLHFRSVRLRFLTGKNPSCAAVCVGTVGLLRFGKR